MVQVLIDDAEPTLFHGEVLRRNDKVVGYVSLLPKTRIHVRTSNICFYFILFYFQGQQMGSFGHTLGASVGLSIVESVDGSPVSLKCLREGKWDVEIADKRWPCTVAAKPLCDPANEKIKA
mmetsp:Transcript_43886/g.86079  ORF Transcript_43886/g.86079 Transcript_43886/m.86079 type:complete len:121 (+) Transcript_43886:1800-2162(+)